MKQPTTATRRSFIAASLATAAGSLTIGCGKKKTEVPAGKQSADFWFSYGGRNREVLEKLIKRFNAESKKHHISAVFQGDYFENLAKLRAAIGRPAVLPTMSHVIGEVVPYLHHKGVLEPLDGYPGAKTLDLVPELAQSGSWIGGDKQPLVCLPFNRSTPIAYFNQSILDELKLEPPKTWEELKAFAIKATVRQGDRTTRFGFECPIAWWFWVAMVGQAGGQVVDPDGTVSLGGAAGVKALRFWQDLVKKERVMKPPPGRDYNAWEATNRDFLAGKAAMIWTSTAFLKYLEDNAKFKVTAAPLPKDTRASVPTGGTHFVLMKDAPAEKKATAWEFLKWMMQPSQTREWATSTGYMPVSKGAIAELEKEGYYKKHPNDRVAYDQLKVAQPWPWSRELFRIQREVVQPRLEKAVLSDEDAQSLMDEARKVAKSGKAP